VDHPDNGTAAGNPSRQEGRLRNRGARPLASGSVVNRALALEMVHVFLKTPFQGRRVENIALIEREESKD
jgi:hypothetical protein